jgi:hypothetical protein
MVMLDLGVFGLVRVALDTGTRYNLVMLDGGEQVPAEAQAVLPWGTIYSQRLQRRLDLRSLPVPSTALARWRRRGMDRFLVNPRLINEQGFTVMDPQHLRLLGFTQEADLRRCYKAGSKHRFFADEDLLNQFYVRASLDDTVAGWLYLDSGAGVTEFYSAHVNPEGAKANPGLSYMNVTGELITPFTAPGHAIAIGDKTLHPALVSLPIGPQARHSENPLGRLGYTDLRGAVIIIPPRSAGYWELAWP